MGAEPLLRGGIDCPAEVGERPPDRSVVGAVAGGDRGRQRREGLSGLGVGGAAILPQTSGVDSESIGDGLQGAVRDAPLASLDPPDCAKGDASSMASSCCVILGRTTLR